MTTNPVIESAEYVHTNADFVALSEEGIESAAAYIEERIRETEYSPNVWRTHPLHFLPPTPYSPTHPRTKQTLDWIFFISALNFSFWSELPEEARYAVDWYEDGWNAVDRTGVEAVQTMWTGYWSLLAATNKALERGIPITDPTFYSDETACPDALIAEVFAPSVLSEEPIPLLLERVNVLREVGKILLEGYKGSYAGFLEAFFEKFGSEATALDLVQMVVEVFPSFRDEAVFTGRKVRFWKRAQILVAETWAAFHPLDDTPHPFFPKGISQLTMFADYRVPQILHNLGIIKYNDPLLELLTDYTPLPSGSIEEMSIRAASILAVERVKEAILKRDEKVAVTSVLIDFWLWDLAKRLEFGMESVTQVSLGESVPIHRTRSIWY